MTVSTTTAGIRARIEALEHRRGNAGKLRVLYQHADLTPEEEAEWEANNIPLEYADSMNVVIRLFGEHPDVSRTGRNLVRTDGTTNTVGTRTALN